MEVEALDRMLELRFMEEGWRSFWINAALNSFSIAVEIFSQAVLAKVTRRSSLYRARGEGAAPHTGGRLYSRHAPVKPGRIGRTEGGARRKTPANTGV